MNVTMPPPAPTAPSPSAPSASTNERVVGRDHSKTNGTVGRRNDEERTFEDQLDEAAVALAPTPQPTPIDAHRESPAPAGPVAVAPTETAATAIVGADAQASPNAQMSSVDATTAAALATPPVAAEPVITEIAVVPTVLPADPTATTDLLAHTNDVPTAPATAGGAPTISVEPAPSDDASDAPTPLAPLPSPVDSGPIATQENVDTGTDPGTSPAALDATIDAAVDESVDAAVDATVDAVTDDAPVADAPDATDATDAATEPGDVSTPPALANLTTPTRRDDTSAARVDGVAPAIVETTDDPPAPVRLAPPRTIAVDLNDEGLGPLRVIATTEQRTVHLTVSAGEAIVRDALVRQQADLRHDLADAGLELGSFEVDARAPGRDHTDQPAPTADRPTATTASTHAAARPVHRTHDADGRLDLRL